MAARGLHGVYSSTNVIMSQVASAPATAADGVDPPASRKRPRPNDDAQVQSMGIQTPNVEQTVASQNGAHLDVATALLLRRWREPALSVHGISCSAANDSIIPKRAVGYISVRTVPAMTSQGTFAAVEAHLKVRHS